ncbi:MAG: hypothetical protein WAL29_17200 [Bacteroidales bacterium]
MESSDQYNFSLFTPRNLHGKKNRNVILSMLAIWAVAVFGFQFLLRVVEKPTPEKALVMFESTWPAISSTDIKTVDYKKFLNSLVLVRGKNIVKAEDQMVLSAAISYVMFNVVPDSVRSVMISAISEIRDLKVQLSGAKDQKYLDLKLLIAEKNKVISSPGEQYSGFKAGSLELSLLTASLQEKYPSSLNDASFANLPQIMKLYLTHNQSFLTDSKFLGFPFHYFYTAVFLLILFIALCIIYNIMIEWRLGKEGIVE